MTDDSPIAAPETLRQMAGAPSMPAPISKSILVIIDAQREYLDGAVPLPDVNAALKNIEALINEGREQGGPILHVVHLGAPGGLFDPENGGRIIEQVSPTEGEVVIAKTLPNAFAGTTLREEVAKLGDLPLLLCGFMTHMCVSSTARAAIDLGLSTVVVSDATATRSLPATVHGEVISHHALHAASLAALSDRFSIVVPTSTLLATTSDPR